MILRSAGLCWTLAVALAGGCSGFSSVDDQDSGADAGAADSEPAITCSGLPMRKGGSLLGEASDGSLTSAMVRAHGRVAVVWEDLTPRRVWLALLDDQGTVKVQPRVLAEQAISPDIAASAAGFTVLVHDTQGAGVALYEVDSEGQSLTERASLDGASIGTGGGYPSVACQGDQCLATYTAGSGTAGFELRYARVGSDGSELASWSAMTGSSGGSAIADVVATPGGGYAAAWIDEREGQQRIFAARLDASGSKRAPGEIVVSSDEHRASFPDIAARGDALLICYSVDGGPQGQGDILCGHVDREGAVTVTERLTDDPRVSSFPEVVWAAGRYLVVFNDERPGIAEVFGQLVDADGHRIGPELRLTDIAATSGYPGVAWVGDGALITWYQYRATTGWSFEYQRFACE